jgi:hypothetical protein
VNKENVLLHQQNKIAAIHRIINQIERLNLRDIFKIVHQAWRAKQFITIIKPETFNLESVKGPALFATYNNPYPLIGFGDMQEVERVPVKDLPLYMGLGHTFKAGSDMLAEGKMHALSLDDKICTRYFRDPKVCKIIRKVEVGKCYKFKSQWYGFSEAKVIEKKLSGMIVEPITSMTEMKGPIRAHMITNKKAKGQDVRHEINWWGLTGVEEIEPK